VNKLRQTPLPSYVRQNLQRRKATGNFTTVLKIPFQIFYTVTLLNLYRPSLKISDNQPHDRERLLKKNNVAVHPVLYNMSISNRPRFHYSRTVHGNDKSRFRVCFGR